MRQTSIKAFFSIKNLMPKQKVIYQVIKRRKEINNRMLSDVLNWPINTVTPRVNELVKMGVVYESTVKKDKKTGRLSIFWKAKK